MSAANYQLEYRNDLNSTNWYSYINRAPVVIDGETTVLVVPTANVQQNYQLTEVN